jgi:hypothetical protein
MAAPVARSRRAICLQLPAQPGAGCQQSSTIAANALKLNRKFIVLA